MADTYVPTAGIHIEDLPTTDTAESTDGLIINSNNNTVNQISLGDLLKETDAKIQANTDLIDSSLDQIFGLGESIPGNADLDDYTTPGRYTCISSDTGKTIVNSPVSSNNMANFGLFVFPTTALTGLRQIQILIANSNSNSSIYYRIWSSETAPSWRVISGTTVSTTSVGDPVVMGDD